MQKSTTILLSIIVATAMLVAPVTANVAHAQDEGGSTNGFDLPIGVFGPLGVPAQLGYTVGSATSVVSFTADAVAKIYNTVAELILRFLGVLVWLMALLFANFIFIALLPLDAIPIVSDGWMITRDIVNLLFLLVWAIMAIGTILNLDDWNYKRILPTLLTIAILINFSFVIAGFLIDLTNILALSFLNAIGDGAIDFESGTGLSQWADNFTATLMHGFSAEKILQINGPSHGLGQSDFAAQSSMAIANTFGILFMLGVLLFFAAIAIILLIRQIALYFLVILMPLAWGARILPNTRGMWSQWWDQFNRWIIFFPALTFFLYLSVRLSNSIGSALTALPISNALDSPAVQLQIQQLSDVETTHQLLNEPILIIQYLIALGFLMGSILVANKIGVQGSGLVQNIVKGGYSYAGNALRGAGGILGRRAAERSGVAETTRRIRTALPEALGGYRPAEAEKRRREEFDKANVPQSRSIALAEVQKRGVDRSTLAERAKALSEAADKGWLDDEFMDASEGLIKTLREGYPQLYQSWGLEKKITSIRPDKAEDPAETLGKIIAKGDEGNIHTDAFKNPGFLSLFAQQARRGSVEDNLSRRQLGTLGEQLNDLSTLSESDQQQQLGSTLAEVKNSLLQAMGEGGREKLARKDPEAFRAIEFDNDINLAIENDQLNETHVERILTQPSTGALRLLLQNDERLSESMDKALSDLSKLSDDFRNNTLLSADQINPGKLRALLGNVSGFGNALGQWMDQGDNIKLFLQNNANRLVDTLNAFDKENKSLLARVQSTVNDIGSADALSDQLGDAVAKRLAASNFVDIPESNT